MVHSETVFSAQGAWRCQAGCFWSGASHTKLHDNMLAGCGRHLAQGTFPRDGRDTPCDCFLLSSMLSLWWSSWSLAVAVAALL
eukprot:8665189-Alexandrium_andersonii.AAC.1